jgi:hypothetical protein
MNKNFPWYDSHWLAAYLNAKEIIKKYNPKKLREFEEAIEPLKTREDFEVIDVPDVLDTEVIENLKSYIHKLENDKKETHELFKFGRIVVHNDPLFNEIQGSLTDLVSKQVKEEVEPSYNFLSLYYDMGVCDVHMDAPDAKWTLDICIEQSYDWQIHIAQRQDWIEDYSWEGNDWSEKIKNDPKNKFKPYSLEPGSGIIFSGSSAWHYRDPIYQKDKQNFCHLIFFHFFPKGMKDIINYQNWADLFDTPELSVLNRPNSEQSIVLNQN